MSIANQLQSGTISFTGSIAPKIKHGKKTINTYSIKGHPEVVAIEVKIRGSEPRLCLVDYENLGLMTERSISYDKTNQKTIIKFNKKNIYLSIVVVSIDYMRKNNIQISKLDDVLTWVVNNYRTTIAETHHRMGQFDARLNALQVVPKDDISNHKRFKQCEPIIEGVDILNYLRTTSKHCLISTCSSYDCKKNECLQCTHRKW